MRKLRFGDLAKGPEFSNYGTEIGSRVPVPEPVLLTSTVSALSQNCILLKFPEDIFWELGVPGSRFSEVLPKGRRVIPSHLHMFKAVFQIQLTLEQCRG